ncbi:efflux transporter outer membrane subunit, partial [Tahibacter caeni]|uniref:efflux transporter outer membrane subunit n=1 Tax=Tahibacter caeni TaxID=1453545 RepID=UPI0021496DBD
WPADAAVQTAAGDAPPAWPDYFTDPQLQSLIRTALAHNADLRIAAARVQQARAAARIQSAEQWPLLAGSADATRLGLPAAVQPLAGGSVLQSYSVSLAASSWELDLWDRLGSLDRAALENYLASDAARHAVRVALIAQVAAAWLALRESDERIALTAQTVATRDASLRIVARRVEVGSSSRLQLTQVETLLIQAQALLEQLQQTRAAQAHALQQLLGTNEPLPATEPAAPAAAFVPLQPGLPSAVLSARPDLVAAEHQLRAAHANVAAARAAFFPRITLTGLFGSGSDELGGLFDGGTGAWLFRPSLSLPLFDAGRRRANLDVNAAREVEAVAYYEKAVQNAFREVADALSARETLTRQLAIAERGVAVLGERARLATLRYDAGAAAYLDVLDAQRDLLGAQQQAVSARRALAASQVALYAALGGGAEVSDTSARYPR